MPIWQVTVTFLSIFHVIRIFVVVVVVEWYVASAECFFVSKLFLVENKMPELKFQILKSNTALSSFVGIKHAILTFQIITTLTGSDPSKTGGERYGVSRCDRNDRPKGFGRR